MVVKITCLEGNGRQIISSIRPKIEAVYFSIVLVATVGNIIMRAEINIWSGLMRLTVL